MNDETERLRVMLERATVPGHEMPEDLDAETASLRESWLAFGRLLTDAQPVAGEAWEDRKVAPQPVPHRRSFGWTVAVAASLLIAAGITIAYRLRDGSSGAQPNSPAIARDDRGPAETVAAAPETPAPPKTEVREDRQIAAVPDELKWDDSLDDQITAVAQAAALAGVDWYAQAGNWSAIERGLDEIKKDIQDGTL